MKMSEEMAVRLHRMMWSDMQRELGDCPSCDDRLKFKHEWVKRNFPGEHVASDCWLCEYASSVAYQIGGDPYCMHCPIKWPNCHCNTLDFSYAKNPISEILAVPAKSDKIMDEKAVITSYYKYREDLLSKASGRPASLAIEEHVKAIQKKAREEGYKTAKDYLAECSGLSQDKLIFDHIKAIQEKAVEEYFKQTPGAKLAIMDVDQAFKQYADEQKAPIFKELSNASGLSENNHAVLDHIHEIVKNSMEAGAGFDEAKYKEVKKLLSDASGLEEFFTVGGHIKKIQEKAVEEYFEKTPGAKLATMDADQAFKQYADEQKAPIFHALAEASGLSAGNESVKAHISEISSKAKSKGRAEMATEIFETLCAHSGVSKDNWSVVDHVKAIQAKASKEKVMETLRKTSMQLADKLNIYKDALSKESDLDRNRPVDDHIREIVKNSMEFGAAEERDRIQEKIEELLS